MSSSFESKSCKIKRNVRSASTGRTKCIKRQEFAARYWSFLFGNLQRCVDEIYRTVEYYEHIESCQEAILVLENYVREFKALAEFFQLNWDFERRGSNRPQSLAWEIKKSTAPKIKRHILKSPTVSGKSSPNSMTSSKSSTCINNEEKFLKFKKYTENLRLNLHPVRGDEFDNMFREIPSFANDNFDFHQKPKSLSLENLNESSVTSAVFCQTKDNEAQTEGFEDDNLTLLEFMEKSLKQNAVSCSIVEVDNKKLDSNQQQPPAPPTTVSEQVSKTESIKKAKTQKKVICASEETVESKKNLNDLKNLKTRVKSPNQNINNTSAKNATSTPTGDGWTMVTRRKSQASITRSNTSTSIKEKSNLSLNAAKSVEKIQKTLDSTKKIPPVRGPPQNKLIASQPGSANSPNSTANNTKSQLSSKKKSHSAPSDKNTKYAQNFVKRQKSDITGLKIKSLHREFLRNKDSKREPKEFREAKLQTTKSVIDPDLKNFKTAKFASKIIENKSDVATVFSSSEEVEDDMESDDDHQKKLMEEQESLERQIKELENTEIDIDTETDETDCEAILNDLDGLEVSDSPEDDKNSKEILEIRYAPMLDDMTPLEKEETLSMLQDLVARYPGRAQKIHERLSSPSRRRSFQETLKKYQAKQIRASEKREALRQQKALKIQQLIHRVEQVKVAKLKLIENRRIKMELKLQRATENREIILKNKIRKAHDEEEKLREIAFIKNIELQNKRLELIEIHREQEGRLFDLEQERLKKHNEKQAKEAIVLKRRQEIEMERRKKLEKIDETRREREQRVGKIQEEKEKARLKLAKEKEIDRNKRIQALQQQHLQESEELQRKILQKQQEYQKRHEESIENIRQRACEMATQRFTDEIKPLTDEDLRVEIAERSKEMVKSCKRKMKKLKEKFNIINSQYLENLPELALTIKKQSQLPKLLQQIKKRNDNNSMGPVNSELRTIGKISRIIEMANKNDFHAFWLLDGLGILTDLINSFKNNLNEDFKNSRQPPLLRVTVVSIQLYRSTCSSCKQISDHAILGGSIISLIDLLQMSLKHPDFEATSTSCPVPLSIELFLTITVVFSNIKITENAEVRSRLHDTLSYLVSSGILELLTKRILMVREPIDSQQKLLLPLLAKIGFVTKVIEVAKSEFVLSIVKSTTFFGTISLLKSAMHTTSQEEIPPRTLTLVGSIYSLFKSVALTYNEAFQEILNDQRTAFDFLDTLRVVFNYCGSKLVESENNEMRGIVKDIIVILGYFTVNNRTNQDILTSDHSYSIVKSILKLPTELAPIFYPTLLVIIWENLEAESKLSRDFDVEMLKEYEKSPVAKKNNLLNLLEI